MLSLNIWGTSHTRPLPPAPTWFTARWGRVECRDTMFRPFAHCHLSFGAVPQTPATSHAKTLSPSVRRRLLLELLSRPPSPGKPPPLSTHTAPSFCAFSSPTYPSSPAQPIGSRPLDKPLALLCTFVLTLHKPLMVVVTISSFGSPFPCLAVVKRSLPDGAALRVIRCRSSHCHYPLYAADASITEDVARSMEQTAPSATRS